MTDGDRDLGDKLIGVLRDSVADDADFTGKAPHLQALFMMTANLFE